MTEIHDFLYPPKEENTRVSHRRYDPKERLVAWSVRKDDHFLLFRVDAFREATLANGQKLDVPETILCRFSEQDVDPNMLFNDERSIDRFDGHYSYDAYGNIDAGTEPGSMRREYAWTGREFEVDTELQFNRTRCYDPTVGRWLSQDPLGYDQADGNMFPYPTK